jgi:hypothetical protein
MNVGDLVKHKRTQAMGMIVRVPKGRKDGAYDVYFDVEWYDGHNNVPGSHLRGELLPAYESR